MKPRPFWISRIRKALETRSIVWLSGVRRVGKTTLVKMMKNCTYLNCDLPATQRILEDPEFYFDSVGNQCIILDEIHRLNDPAILLKIAADEYPGIKIIATGSSTLSATKKFRDSLTGRKTSLYLPPVLWTETINAFGISNLDHRLLHGGLPEQLLRKNIQSDFFGEWLDSYYARDIQELFGYRNRHGFLKLMNLVFMQSGGSLEYTRLSKRAEISRPTVIAHIDALQIAHAIFLVPPFHGGGKREIVKMPKLYAFDTGMVAYVKGWTDIRPDDRGLLWEHLVLDALRSKFKNDQIHYWRDKSEREVDFIIAFSNEEADGYECKINPDYFDSASLKIFRNTYARGKNFCISPMVKTPYRKNFNGLIVEFISIQHLF